jgi:hypothetical protein
MAGQSLAAGKAEVAKLDFSQEEIDRLKNKLLQLTEATITVRVGRDKDGKIMYGEVPNVGIQLAATVKAMEFGVGKPKQMIEVQGGGPARNESGGLRDLGRLIQQNPDVAHAVLKAVKDSANLAQAIDVTGTSGGKRSIAPESQSGGSPS